MEQPDSSGVENLWRALADELKLPLVQIARSAELGEVRTIQIAADNALKLIDSYLLVTGLSRQQQLALQPVSLTATLYDVSQDLHDLSNLYDTRVDIRVKGSPGRVMAHPVGLKAALTSLAYTMLTGGLKSREQTITLLAESHNGLVTAGVISSSAHLNREALDQARQLFGRAKQPAGAVTQNSGVGLYMADNLFSAMQAPLKTIKSGRQTGLATDLVLSQQLALL